MIKKIVLGLILVVVVLIGVLLALASRQPDSFKLERTAKINASPEKVFAVLNDFHSWKDWSPWEKLDPDMRKTFSGSESGVGALYAWEGNKDVGQGSMEITESVPDSRIALDLKFIKPFKAENVTEFTLAPDGEGTRVTWAMSGKMIMVSKIMSLFVSMDKMVGKDFEKGLANLKALLE